MGKPTTPDIVERLRDCAGGFGSFKTDRGDFGVCDEAADEIERLRGARRLPHLVAIALLCAAFALWIAAIRDGAGFIPLWRVVSAEAIGGDPRP